ncbi:MAG: diaminohydroxyphosphoribosylaminopyrimidine deaminase / 5-amino-6-(5-phosphoribosylamino)uracil reductase [archaeon GW2011_AR10]|nr:MAG: diaminohydroxyphosphoribosylaminopyrimidine deaminase / 5-amino-6-(5-phosphoribosylamino)uracil reductase [archaeon GW2011_AR10]
MQMREKELMQLALNLAEGGRGFVEPNPKVGCVIEKKGIVVGKGFHKRFGGAHAEAIALEDAGKRAEGATMHVTLEPCCHYGKQGPCTEKIIEAGIKRVVVALRDPNPLVNGRGLKQLRKAGIKVKVVNSAEAEELNEGFLKFHRTGTPFVLLKSAITFDGKIAWGKGRKIISGKESIKLLHLLRNEFDAVLVGVNTVVKDDPLLTARTAPFRNPLRVVVDSKARVPLKARVLGGNAKTVIACTASAPSKRIEALVRKGVGVITVRERNGQVDLRDLVAQLGKAGIQSILVEGGSEINSSALRERIVDKVMLFVSPKIAGKGTGVVNDEKLLDLLSVEKASLLLKDLLIEARPRL